MNTTFNNVALNSDNHKSVFLYLHCLHTVYKIVLMWKFNETCKVKTTVVYLKKILYTLLTIIMHD